jgi:hypothetical protein
MPVAATREDPARRNGDQGRGGSIDSCRPRIADTGRWSRASRAPQERPPRVRPAVGPGTPNPPPDPRKRADQPLRSVTLVARPHRTRVPMRTLQAQARLRVRSQAGYQARSFPLVAPRAGRRRMTARPRPGAHPGWASVAGLVAAPTAGAAGANPASAEAVDGRHRCRVSDPQPRHRSACGGKVTRPPKVPTMTSRRSRDPGTRAHLGGCLPAAAAHREDRTARGDDTASPRIRGQTGDLRSRRRPTRSA